ncbi:hypothetical protein B0H65DRAFT_465153 [Neurospora tetraspora]|uniref:Uncharacterized protein n=1 Tax=Neurospora tetraspora TaxID=94610 RepID=A0AAE0JEU7_9PEZI|nr:hypothetical protein B0H65DRAFT_465153 [Neurospora tetraspora]
MFISCIAPVLSALLQSCIYCIGTGRLRRMTECLTSSPWVPQEPPAGRFRSLHVCLLFHFASKSRSRTNTAEFSRTSTVSGLGRCRPPRNGHGMMVHLFTQS